MKYPLRLPLVFGHRPSEPGDTRRPGAASKLAPDKIKKLSLSEEMYDFLVRFMAENRVEDISKVTAFIEFVVFDDETAWIKGHVMHRNPDNPKEWVVKGVWREGRASFYKSPFPKHTSQMPAESLPNQ